MPEGKEKNGFDQDGDKTRRVTRTEIHSRRLPVHHADRQGVKSGSEDLHEMVLPKLTGISTEDQREWLSELVDNDPRKLRVIEFVAKLEPIKMSKFIRLFMADKDAPKIIERMAALDDTALAESIQGYITGSDVTKINDELRKGLGDTRSKVSEELRQKPQGSKQTVKEAVKKEETIDIEKVPHRIENLLEISDPQERKRAVKAVFELMQQHSFRNMSADDRAKYGCIYHVSPTLDELERHIRKAALYPIIRRTDTGKIFAFGQIEEGRRIRKLNSARKIRHKENGKLEAILKTPEEKIFHEQLVVVDRNEKFMGARIKGAGKKLLKWCFDKARAKGIVIFTTEVQSGNNRSGGFHIEVGYKYVGQIEERPSECDPVQFDIFALDLREPGQQDPALTRNDSPTPTVEGS